eukprot:7865927-Karenia_brevis.AAC.1
MQLAGKAETKDLQKTRQQCEALSQGEIPDTVKEEFAKMNAELAKNSKEALTRVQQAAVAHAPP